jgi:hypothetical protein
MSGRSSAAKQDCPHCSLGSEKSGTSIRWAIRKPTAIADGLRPFPQKNMPAPTLGYHRHKRGWKDAI